MVGCRLDGLVAVCVGQQLLWVAAAQQLLVLHLQGAVLGVHLVEQRDAAELHHLGAPHARALVVVEAGRGVVRCRQRIGRLQEPLAVTAPHQAGAPAPGLHLQPDVDVTALLLWAEQQRAGQQQGVGPGRPGGGLPELTQLLSLTLQLCDSGLEQEEEMSEKRETEAV